MDMPGRKFGADNRYGFNGKENDPETNTQDYGMRIYDPRVGRFLSVDPITGEYPELTPYQFASNRPIQGIDLDGLEFYSASDSYINFYINYDSKLKKVTSGSVHYDLSNPNRPAGLDEALKSRTTCTNCIGVDASVASFNIVMKPSLVTTASEAEMKDIDDPNAVGGGGISMPTIPQNKTQERQQRKTREFSTVVGTNSSRMNAIGAAIEVGVKIAEWRRGNYWNNYMKDVKWQTSSSTPLIVNILQYGIDNNIITDGYQNRQSLSQLANYLMKGQELTKWDENNKLVTDDKLTGIGKALWNVYAEAKKEDDQNKLIERRQQAQRSSTDNTANSVKPIN
jgi:RHS repeat-associated protein